MIYNINNTAGLEQILAKESPVKPGDEIVIKGGVYNGKFDCYINGEIDNPITIRGEGTIIDTKGINNRKNALQIMGSYLIFKDL